MDEQEEYELLYNRKQSLRGRIAIPRNRDQIEPFKNETLQVLLHDREKDLETHSQSKSSHSDDWLLETALVPM